MTDFDPKAWLEQGRANLDKLPDGVVLPEPSFDYERYRAVLQNYYNGANSGCVAARIMDGVDKNTIDGLLAVADEVIAVRDALKSGGWVDWAGGECPVPVDAVVEYRMRGGSGIGAERAGSLRGSHGTGSRSCDIVEYRVVR